MSASEAPADATPLADTPARIGTTLVSENVLVAVTGAVYVAPLATTAPADAATALPAAWKSLGYLSEDGITISPSKVDTKSIQAWQESAEVRKSVTKVENTVEFTMIEMKADTLSLFLGETIAAAGKDYNFGGPGGGRMSFVVDVIDGTKTVRYYIPIAEVTERGSLDFKNGDPVGMKVTLSAYPAAALSGRAFAAHHSAALV